MNSRISSVTFNNLIKKYDVKSFVFDIQKENEKLIKRNKFLEKENYSLKNEIERVFKYIGSKM